MVVRDRATAGAACECRVMPHNTKTEPHDAIRRRLMQVPGIVWLQLQIENGYWWAKIYSANDVGWHKVSDLLKRI